MTSRHTGLTLAADVGGTKTLLGLFEGDNCVFERRLANAEFGDFAAALASFLDVAKAPSPQRACLALAGPIADDGRSAKLTNLPWQVDAASLERRFSLPPLTLVNDFAAAAVGAVTSPAEQRATLQTGQALETAPHLVVGAGTGLGMAVVLKTSAGLRVIPGEGGHVAFAPADAIQSDLWQALHARFGRVTWERVASGPGLEFIHRHLGGDTATAAVISDTALAQPDSTAGRALDLFLACYGAYAGDMAMAVLARGGVHLAGGIAAKVLPALQRGGFCGAFNAKAEHAHLVQSMPVHVCLDPALGLRGAARLALT